MKMVKSLLLGSAAGLVAVAGAQAADMPVKAKPVQYVKICSLYGAGFYYIPGTDTCIKIGGWVRQYLGVNGPSLTNGALAGNYNTRNTNSGWTWKVRGYITADARNQTEYGTVRGYLAVGTSIQGTNGGQGAAGSAGVNPGGFNANRAFVQWAGFTFGVSQSFYDLFSMPAISYWGGMANPTSDTGDGGQTVTAYTAQFGNGFSASLSLEAPRSTEILEVGAGSPAWTGPFGPPGPWNAATRYPDIVANLRVDQAWGSAQIMGAIHDVAGEYYGAAGSATPGLTSNGAPGYATGYAFGAGVKINTPMIGKGDYFGAQFNYAVGASGYPDDGATTPAPATGAGSTQASNFGGYGAQRGGPGGTSGFGIVSDGVYAVGGSIQLTTLWGIGAGYEHFWTPHWQTSVYGTYLKNTYNSVANTNLCASEIGVTNTGLTVANCGNNWDYWTIGSRTQFNIDSQTYIGLDVIYTQLDTASNGVTGTVLGSAANGVPAQLRTYSNESAWMAEMRIHRNFYP